MKISIIVPIYNVEKYLSKCVRSLIGQTLTDLEIILIDDGSTDSSGKLCDELASTDKRIRVLHKNNGGVSSARNLGLDIAKGEYIGFVDPDDWCETEMYERMYAAAKANDCDLVISGYFVDHDNEVFNRKEETEVEGIVTGYEALYQCLRGQGHGCFTAVWNKLIRRDCIGNIRFNMNYRISEDEVFLCEVTEKIEKAFIIKSPYYHWYQSDGSAIRSDTGFLEKWESSYSAKVMIPDLVSDEMCRRLARANIYATLFSVVWNLLYSDEKEKGYSFLSKLLPYRRDFIASREFSIQKKLRYELILLLIRINAPKSLIYRLGKLTTVGIKNKIKQI